MSDMATKKAGRNLIRTILIVLGILLVYAITVQVTDINLEKPLDPARQDNLLNALRQLADPDLIGVDEDTGDYFITETTKITIERIIETIFMALIASTVGTILAVPVSFLGARNLMEDIVAPMASVMAAIVALLIGAVLGSRIATGLLILPEYVADNSLLGLPPALGLLIALLITLGIMWILLRLVSMTAPDDEPGAPRPVLSSIFLVLTLLVSIVALGFLAYLGMLVGEWLGEAIQFFTFLGINFFGFIGEMVYVLSDLLRLLLPAVVALLVGVVAASFAARYSQEAVLKWSDTPAKVLTGILTLLGTFVITFGIGAFWNWLYEYDNAQNAILAPSIAGGFFVAILFLTQVRIRTNIQPTIDRFGRVLFFLGVAGIATFAILKISELFNQTLDVNSATGYLIIPALTSGIVAGLITGLSKPNHPYNIGFTTYTITRGILNILRSIEPLIMGIVFVVWVSLGPFAGIMALTLHTIAALGKLFSEQVEGIDEGPVEAITATGASRLQMIVYAVIPQIVPPFTAFALYRWDINVRMSTIIGFVGGGGIGFVLSQNIQQGKFRAASVMMLSIAIVVAALDYASAKIRSRII